MNWKRLIAKYLEELRGTALTSGVLANRAQWLKRFLLWCSEQGVRSAAEVTSTHIDHYIQFLRVTPTKHRKFYSPFTIRQALHTVRQFFHWATQRGHLLIDPAQHLTLPRIDARLTPVSVEDVRRVMEAALNEGRLAGIRDRALLEVFYRAGIRRTECAKLKLRDLDLQARTLRVICRGGKERLAPIDDELAHWLERYLHECRPQLAGRAARGALFLSMKGTPYTVFCLSEMLRRVFQRAQVKVTAHVLRHACAVHLLEAGADLAEVRQRLGNHTDLTAQKYLNAATAAIHRQPRRPQTVRPLTNFLSLVEEVEGHAGSERFDQGAELRDNTDGRERR